MTGANRTASSRRRSSASQESRLPPSGLSRRKGLVDRARVPLGVDEGGGARWIIGDQRAWHPQSHPGGHLQLKCLPRGDLVVLRIVDPVRVEARPEPGDRRMALAVRECPILDPETSPWTTKGWGRLHHTERTSERSRRRPSMTNDPAHPFPVTWDDADASRPEILPCRREWHRRPNGQGREHRRRVRVGGVGDDENHERPRGDSRERKGGRRARRTRRAANS